MSDDTGRYVGRGGLKLEAALKQWGLEAAVRAATCIDVGASTGGFTDCLLQHGATRVTAIDVGHGQLHTRLRGDPRIEEIEGVHFKTLALSVAPGPYDFFVVDVSFISARNMLRGLAFRLREGAQGVILVKPQFELPTGYVKGGQVKAEGLRGWAVERVKKKGEGLGFELLGVVDSPVPGGEGTVELLTWWRWVGRGERMPEWKTGDGDGDGAGVGAGAGAGAEETGHRPQATGHRQQATGGGAQANTSAKPSASTKPSTGAKPSAKASASAGTKPSTGAKASASAVASEVSWFAVVGPGLEEVVRGELAGLAGVKDVRGVEGGVEFKGGMEVGLRANLASACATRVVMRVGAFRAKDFPALYKKARALPWESWLASAEELEVKATAHRSRLRHTGRIEETLKAAARDRLAEGRAGVRAQAGGMLVMARVVEDEFTISVDASGELLHKRGWREDGALAPMRETLAAAVLALSGWQAGTPLVDPMCGSGSFVIEAALRARGVAPGAGRRFAMQRWSGVDAAMVERVRAELRAREQAPGAVVIGGSDREPTAIAAARRNAERAGVLDSVSLEVRELGQAAPPAAATGPGLFIANPPYGVRIGEGEDLGALYAQFGRVAREQFAGWRVALVTSDESLARRTGLKFDQELGLFSGGLRVKLYLARGAGGGGAG